ncbi:hypothetical protein [uncultured Celeribacter sp.]|uniref:hypothetical protein n=1 Tax=uncultured Celeribacter sp. TaxID=1303376 RepID=UPI002AA8BB14|nr:hypothetical protein [uncultured Celeribacter sp.]
MSRWLQLVDEGEENHKPLPDTLTEPDTSPDGGGEMTFCHVLSGCRVEKLEKENTAQKTSPSARRAAPDPHDTAQPSRLSVGSSPCTWTGKVVSLEEWKRMSDWERHGPNGRHWNALSRKWEYPA